MMWDAIKFPVVVFLAGSIAGSINIVFMITDKRKPKEILRENMTQIVIIIICIMLILLKDVLQ